MSPRDTARAIAAGRIAFGAAMVAAPRLVSASFLGRHGRGPAASFYARATGARDIVVGGLALHTIDRPEVGPRYVATSATIDAVDGLSVLAVRRDIGAGRTALALLVALGSAAAGSVAARGLKQQSTAA
jgi:hypothetical protein